MSMKCLVGDGKKREGGGCGNEKRSVQKVFFCTGGTNLAGKRCKKRALLEYRSCRSKLRLIVSSALKFKMFQGDTAYR